MQALPDALIREQLEAVFASLPIAAVKVGYCPTASSIRVVARWLRERPHLTVIVDPVIKEQTGIPIVQPEVIAALQHELLPRATLATPNHFEAAQISGLEEVLTCEDLETAARWIFANCGCPTVVTGGNMGDESLDVYAGMDGVSHFTAPIVKRPGKIIGGGCTYAAAITAQLARGEGLRESLWAAKSYVAALIEAAPPAPPEGYSPLCHVHPVDSLAQGDGIGVSTRAFQRRDDSGGFPLV